MVDLHVWETTVRKKEGRFLCFMKNKNYHLTLVQKIWYSKKTFYVWYACSYLYKYLYKNQNGGQAEKNVFWRGITLLYLFGCRKKWRQAYRDVGKLCLTCSEISRDFANFEMKYSDLWISIDFVNCGHFSTCISYTRAVWLWSWNIKEPVRKKSCNYCFTSAIWYLVHGELYVNKKGTNI